MFIFWGGLLLVIWFFRFIAYLEGQRRKVARECAAANNVQAWFTKHPPAPMAHMRRGHPPRPPRARGRSAARGDYFPFHDDFPPNLTGE